jgi:hypothetical protein
MTGEQVLADAVSAYRSALGERLAAAYALGSLAHGGFSPLVSDVDLGLILSDPVHSGDARTIQAVADTEKARGAQLAQRLSVFWGTPSTLRGEHEGGRFPALDRLDLLDHGRLLAGRDARSTVSRPSTPELLISGAEFAIEQLSGEEMRRPELLIARGVRRVTKVVLFPVRFMFTAATGQVGTNHDAVSYHLEREGAPASELVATALAWRIAGPVDPRPAAELLRGQMVPLYLYYIDDHVTRLSSLGRGELVRSFELWRARLTR